METGHGEKKNTARQGVAIVGFIAIAIIGMAIAIYAARFVPSAISSLAGAGAFVSDIFILEENPSKPAAPTKEEPKEETPAKPVEEESTPDEETPVVTPPAPAPTTPVTYSGFPDLRADITAVGYCASRNQASFVRATSIPRGAAYGGAQFMLSNVGTNIASGWTFAIDTPKNERIESAGVTLRPAQSASGVTCFPYDSGVNTVSVRIDSRGSVFEASETNNVDSASISAQGTTGGNNDNNDDLWCDITASDRSIDEGDYTDLEFDIEGADEARINNGVGSVDEDGGEERVRPREDTTYRLTVENDDGDTETCSVTIRVDEN
jgi:hypothetical protein